MKQNEKKCCVRKIIGGKQNLNLTGWLEKASQGAI
jgi:hypothetical protein